MRKASRVSSPPAPEPEKFERWTAQRKAAIVLDVIKGKISVLEAARKYGFT
jgi:transposase-like protein